MVNLDELEGTLVTLWGTLCDFGVRCGQLG